MRRRTRRARDGPSGVGDWVVLRGGQSTVRRVERSSVDPPTTEASSFVEEAEGGSSAQVVAANVDFAFLVTAVAGDLNSRRLER